MRHYSLAIHYSLIAGLCCDMVYGHSHDLVYFPSYNDGMGKVLGHSKMD